MSLIQDVSKEIDQINRNQHAKLGKRKAEPYGRIGEIEYTKAEVGVYSLTIALGTALLVFLVIIAFYSGG